MRVGQKDGGLVIEKIVFEFIIEHEAISEAYERIYSRAKSNDFITIQAKSRAAGYREKSRLILKFHRNLSNLHEVQKNI